MSTADGVGEVPRELPPLAEQAKKQDASEFPSPNEVLPDVVIYSHSSLIYWWPVWLFGYACAAFTYIYGEPFVADNGEGISIYPGTGLGLAYTAILLATLVITNARLRGIYSIVALLSIGFILVTLGWAGMLDDIARIIPQFSVHMNAGFYVVVSTVLLLIWLSAFFIFDRLTFWRVRPGQLTQESLIGDSEESFDTRGMLFEKHGEDILRHRVLGLGAGDLQLMTAGAKKRTIAIPDVLFVNRTVDRVQRLIAVEPNELMK
jgi:hypothetical protein